MTSPRTPTNTMALLALVFAFVFAPLAVVFGTTALSQIRRTGEAGRGLALTGLVIGLTFTLTWLCAMALLLL